MVETKTKRASRSGAHHDHAGMLGEGGDGLEQPDHGEVGHGEERVAPGDSSQPKWCKQAEEER